MISYNASRDDLAKCITVFRHIFLSYFSSPRTCTIETALALSRYSQPHSHEICVTHPDWLIFIYFLSPAIWRRSHLVKDRPPFLSWTTELVRWSLMCVIAVCPVGLQIDALALSAPDCHLLRHNLVLCWRHYLSWIQYCTIDIPVILLCQPVFLRLSVCLPCRYQSDIHNNTLPSM